MTDGRDKEGAALGEDDDQTTVGRLSEACRLNPADFSVHLALGQALTRLGRAEEAVTTLERAVSLAPTSSEARRDLGIALAAGGRTPEAIRVLQHALTLRPNDRIALETLDRLRRPSSMPAGEAALPAHSAITRQLARDPIGIDTYPLPPAEVNPPVARRIVLLDPDAEMPESAPYSPPFAVGHEPTLAMMAPPPGQTFAEQPIPHYGFPSATAGPAEAGIPWAGTVDPAVRGRDDEFSVADAYYDLIEILAAPRDFFDAQTGLTGNRAPLSMLVAYTLNIALGLLALLFTQGARFGPGGMILVLLSPIFFVLFYSGLTAVALGSAAALHACCALFRGRASYSGSFRAAVYAAAPLCTAVALALFLTPMTARNAPLAALHDMLPPMLAAVGALWSLALLGAALRYIHSFSRQVIVVILLLLGAFCIGGGLLFSLLPAIG